GSSVGRTAPYMLPEQCLGTRKIDVRSDVYSFGCILYEMCTGRRVFYGNSVEEVFMKHLKETPEFPSHLNQRLPRALVNLTQACLEKHPEDRPQTFQEVSAAIQKTLQDEGHGNGLLFFLFGFSGYSDRPRAKSEWRLSQATEAIMLEASKGVDYVIQLGLVKDRAEFETLKNAEMGRDREAERKKI